MKTLQGRGRPRKDSKLATLRDLGVTRNESSQWQRLAREWTDDELKAAGAELKRPSLAALNALAGHIENVRFRDVLRDVF
jgi:hypothetical protein